MYKHSQAQFYTYYVKMLGREPVMCVSQTLQGFYCMLNWEKHWIQKKNILNIKVKTWTYLV